MAGACQSIGHGAMCHPGIVCVLVCTQEGKCMVHVCGGLGDAGIGPVGGHVTGSCTYDGGEAGA